MLPLYLCHCCSPSNCKRFSSDFVHFTRICIVLSCTTAFRWKYMTVLLSSFFSWGQHLSMQAEIWPMMKSNVKCLVARTRDRRLVEGHTVKNEDSGECTGLQKIETVLQYTRLQWLRYICHVGNDILGRFLALKWLPKKSQKKPWRPRRICERTMEETFQSIGLSLELSGDVCC